MVIENLQKVQKIDTILDWFFVCKIQESILRFFILIFWIILIMSVRQDSFQTMFTTQNVRYFQNKLKASPRE